MSIFTATVATSERHVLAEGPVWNKFSQTLRWVDIERGRVFQGRLEENRIELIDQLDFVGTVGAVVASIDGQILVAGQEGLTIIGSDGQRTFGPQLVEASERKRLNDGACDPAGRFLVGTLSLDEAHDPPRPTERLLRVEHDKTITILDSDLTLSNGLAWSPDGKLFYSVDTLTSVVWKREYDSKTGRVGRREVLMQITDGFPGGLCVDSRGFLWIAIWGSGEVRSFSPSGQHVDTVLVDAPHASSIAFVGQNLDLLVITTASRDLGPDQLLRYPNAGCLFIADVNATGTPCAPWSAFQD